MRQQVIEVEDRRLVLETNRDITERKRAEEALKQSEATVQAALASMADAVFVSDAEGRFIEFNDAFVSYHRFRDRSDCSESIADCANLLDVWFTASGEPAPPEMWAVSRALRGESATGFEYTLRRRETGETWTGSYNFAPIRDERGVIVGSVVTARDVTERKQTEEALRDSEQRFHTLFDSLIEGFCTIEMIFDEADNPVDYCFLQINQAFEGLTGLHEAQGKRMRELAPDHDAHWFEIYGRVASTGEPARFQAPATALGRYYDVSAYRIGGPESRRVGILFNDITERKQAEEALRESEERLSSVLASSRDVVYRVDIEAGEYEYISPSSEQVLGYTPDELMALTQPDAVRAMIHPDDVPAFREAIARSTDLGWAEAEWRQLTKSGEYRWLSTCFMVTRDEAGHQKYRTGTARDITESKQAEAEREWLLAEEQALVEELAASNEELQSQTEELAAREQELQAQNEELLASRYNRTLIEASLDPLVTIGLDGTITDVNEAAVKIRGYCREEIIGTDFSDYFTDPEKARLGYQEVFALGSVTDYPLTICARDGKLTDVLYNASVYKDEEGNVLGVFAAARDVGALRQLEVQREIASTLQNALFDIPEETGLLRFSHLYRSATLEASIGGDFYDVFKVRDDRVAVLIGDVAGHGVQAARVATLVKDVVHAFAHQSGRPSVVLRETNELLVEKRVPGFVTVFLGMFDPNTGILEYSSAGHPPGLLRNGQGEVEELAAGSPPVGIFSGQSWKDDRVQLKKDDLLFLYTDGIIEARRNGDFFGQEGLARALTHWKSPSPELLPETVLDEVLSFCGCELSDDVAMLALSLGEMAATGPKRAHPREKPLG
jgi:PAS domain S-box-containing protein